MHIKAIFTLTLGILLAFTLISCGQPAAPTSVSDASPAPISSDPSQQPADSTAFTFAYPYEMQTLGFHEPLVLDYVPQKVACMSTAPVLALLQMEVPLIAVPESVVVPYPDDLDATFLGSVVSEDFDIETVVSLEPDLVIAPYSVADSHGATLEGLGIPVYYVYSGPAVGYQQVKEQTQTIADAFSVDDASTALAEEMMESFDALEARISETAPSLEGVTVMVLQSGSANMHMIQTRDGTLGAMADMIGLTNVYENSDSATVMLDMEQALDYNPDLVLSVGLNNSADQQAMMEGVFASNPAYWNAIPAIGNGDIIYLDSSFWTTSGYGIIDCVNHLMDIVTAKLAG